jgi:hypothetical protein
MKKVHMIALGAAVAIIAGGHGVLYAKDGEAVTRQDTGKLSADPDSQAGDRTSAEGKDTDGHKNPGTEPGDFEIEEKEDRRLEKELKKEKREYKSLITKDTFSFHLGFSIGGIGYGVVGGALNASRGLYRFRYQKRAFQFGFRGGIEGMFFVNRANSLSLGVFYEQRKVELKINYIWLTRIVLPVDPPILLLHVPVFRYIPRSVVDLNSLNFPVMYRYYVLDEFYIGIGVDVAWVFQAHAGFNFFLFGWSTNLKKRLSPIDIGGKLAFGVTINRVFIELGVGAGVLNFDRMSGDRHSIYLTAVIGYRV